MFGGGLLARLRAYTNAHVSMLKSVAGYSRAKCSPRERKRYELNEEERNRS